MSPSPLEQAGLLVAAIVIFIIVIYIKVFVRIRVPVYGDPAVGGGNSAVRA